MSIVQALQADWTIYHITLDDSDNRSPDTVKTDHQPTAQSCSPNEAAQIDPVATGDNSQHSDVPPQQMPVDQNYTNTASTRVPSYTTPTVKVSLLSKFNSMIYKKLTTHEHVIEKMYIVQYSNKLTNLQNDYTT
jgi:hypothetical protein